MPSRSTGQEDASPLPFQSSGLSVPRERLPAALQPYVREYYEEEMAVPPGQRLRLPISATTEPFLNATLSGEVVVELAGGFRIPPVTLAGPRPEPYEVEIAGTVRGFYIRFTTVGPLALLGVEDYSLTERGARPLHEMVRPELAEAARRWGENQLAAPSFETRAKLSDRFLLGCTPEVSPRTAFLQAAVAAIEQASGNVRMDDLARALGCNTSTLRRHFHVLGMPPKRFAEILRFRRAHAFLHTTPDASWSEVVARFGYSDQAHFVREYRRFSGTPPTRWQAGRRLLDLRMGIEEQDGDNSNI